MKRTKRGGESCASNRVTVVGLRVHIFSYDGFTKLRMARKNNKSKRNNNNLITYLLVSYALTQESRTEKAKKLRRHG